MENLIAFNNEFPYISDGSIAYFFLNTKDIPIRQPVATTRVINNH